MIKASSSKKVEVDVYYETRCPDSVRFIRNQLYPVFQKLKTKDIVNFNLYPYGKVSEKKVDGYYTFKCQHGKMECYLNIVENCMKFVYRKTPIKMIPYVNCLAKLPISSGAKHCAVLLHLDWFRIKECADGGFGKALLHDVGLMKKVKTVPYIVIDGDESRSHAATSTLMKEICKKIEGKKPEECKYAKEAKNDKKQKKKKKD